MEFVAGWRMCLLAPPLPVPYDQRCVFEHPSKCPDGKLVVPRGSRRVRCASWRSTSEIPVKTC
jgi:hypothetical protein